MRHRLGPADLGDGAMRGYAVTKDRHVLVSRLGGIYFAIDDWCNHAGCLLSGGWRHPESEAVVCPCHEMTFELKTGRLLSIPRLCEDQKTYPVEEERGVLYVEIADGA